MLSRSEIPDRRLEKREVGGGTETEAALMSGSCEFGLCEVKVLKGMLCCRSHAIACVNQFIISRTQALMLHIDGFIEASLTPQ